MMSAKLKTGKLKRSIFMKSLTPHNSILSIKFPAVHAIRNAAVTQFIFFIINNRINATIPTILTNIIMKNGTGSDREIPRFNTG